MIYLTTELQRKIIPIFHYSLNNKGIMFMGPAETIGGFTEMFISIDPKWKLYERKDGGPAINKMIDFPFHVARQPTSTLKLDEVEKTTHKAPMAETFNRILLENFTPASVLVNDKGDILYTNGKTGNFLELPRGEAIMNIYRMAREELRYVIGNIIRQAQLQKTLVKINDIKLPEGEHTRLLNLQASVVKDTTLNGLLLVVFEDKGLIKKQNRKLLKGDSAQAKAVEELEKELVYTKQQLHSTIEQMETSLEELKSTNEELQSTNEELQSTNEESLTTKEEMQSLNEELMTINVQYQSKAEELSRLNNDMKNLLDSTEIGTIFLNNNLEILRYTPQINKLFNVIPADVGRSLAHVVSNFEYDLIREHIKEVIDRLAIKEIEVKTKTNEWYNVRIMPYRTLDNFISGAVLTFSLITGYKHMEHELKSLQAYVTNIINVLPQPALQLDNNLKIKQVNKLFKKTFAVNVSEITGMAFEDFAHNNWKTTELDHLLQQISQGEQEVTTTFKTSINSKEYIYILKANVFNYINTNESMLLLVIIQDSNLRDFEKQENFNKPGVL
jgi:two-component system CheB/CheR fusion protein